MPYLSPFPLSPLKLFRKFVCQANNDLTWFCPNLRRSFLFPFHDSDAIQLGSQAALSFATFWPRGKLHRLLTALSPPTLLASRKLHRLSTAPPPRAFAGSSCRRDARSFKLKKKKKKESRAIHSHQPPKGTWGT